MVKKKTEGGWRHTIVKGCSKGVSYICQVWGKLDYIVIVIVKDNRIIESYWVVWGYWVIWRYFVRLEKWMSLEMVSVEDVAQRRHTY